MLQKINAETLLPSLGGPQAMPPEQLAWLTTRVNLFFGSFRKADADDPETFHSGCTRLFSAYPQEVVDYVVDPVTGLSGRVEWLPPLAKVKQALDERAGQIAQTAARERREREQLEARRIEQEKAARKPTLEELKEKHGANWGLAVEEQDKKLRARRMERLQEANQRMFAAECEAAGMPADSLVSPTLRALIEGR